MLLQDSGCWLKHVCSALPRCQEHSLTRQTDRGLTQGLKCTQKGTKSKDTGRARTQVVRGSLETVVSELRPSGELAVT